MIVCTADHIPTRSEPPTDATGVYWEQQVTRQVQQQQMVVCSPSYKDVLRNAFANRDEVLHNAHAGVTSSVSIGHGQQQPLAGSTAAASSPLHIERWKHTLKTQDIAATMATLAAAQHRLNWPQQAVHS